jgi:hypothetical protein
VLYKEAAAAYFSDPSYLYNFDPTIAKGPSKGPSLYKMHKDLVNAGNDITVLDKKKNEYKRNTGNPMDPEVRTKCN